MALDITANGKLTVDPRVNPRRVEHMAEMVAAARMGGNDGDRARIDLRETLTTSDAPFSFAHLVNLRNLPKYEEQEPDFSPIVTNETVPDFRPATFYNLRTNFEGLEHGKDNDGQRIAPRVAETDTYQYAFGYTQESTDIAVQKRGFKTGWSLEAAVNNTYGFISQFPEDMYRVGAKTDQYVVFRALRDGVTSASELKAGTDFITGEEVPAKSPLTPSALRVAIRQIGQRKDADGVRIPVPARFRLVVPIGTADEAQYAINVARGIIAVQDGLITYGGGAVTNGDPLGRIAGIIESEFVEDGSWYLVPEAGTTQIPALIRVRLAGFEIPEVYVSNFNGAPILGGASADPFQAFSFDNDTIDLKFRMFTNAGLFSEDAVVWSDGSGA